MDRYVLLLSLCRDEDEEPEVNKLCDLTPNKLHRRDAVASRSSTEAWNPKLLGRYREISANQKIALQYPGVQQLKHVYERLLDSSTQGSVSVLPACSLSGNPSSPRWYFALQACQGGTQFCSSDWEELGSTNQRSQSEEAKATALELCLTSLSDQQASEENGEPPALMDVLEEAAEGLHVLSDKLPPPGKALLDVLLLASAAQPPSLKDLLPLLGALKHMSCWHAARTTVLTQNAGGWQKVASYLSAGVVDPADLDGCIHHSEVWRGGLLIRERKYVSELRFDGFSLRSPDRQWSRPSLSLLDAFAATEHKVHTEVFHYYAPLLELVQMVSLSDLPSCLMSSTHFELGLSGGSMKAKLLLDQLKSLRGKVGALFSLACTVTSVAQPSAGQLGSQRWRDSLAKRPKSFPVPDVEVKGETAHYFLLVQGSDDGGTTGACRVTMLHADGQINGAAAMATISGLLREKSLSSSAGAVGDILRSLPRLHGDELLRRERKVTRVQTLVLKEYLKRREASAAVKEAKAILSAAREQYLRMTEATPPAATHPMATPPTAAPLTRTDTGCHTVVHCPAPWPERNVLHNIENLQKRRQKRRFGLLGSGSTDNLLGPRDSQRGSSALLDAKELLKHFTLDGNPAGELQPLCVTRGSKVFEVSADLSPRRISEMPFSEASAAHYHGLEFCLDARQSLDRDQAFVRLQSRLIRYETQTTCSKEPCALPFALSPAPSPAVMSEPGSVPDGETLQNADVARLKRQSWDTDAIGGRPRKRLVKSESSDSLGSQSSGSSGTHPTVRSLRQQTSRSQSTSSSSSLSSATRQTSTGLVNLSLADKAKAPEQRTPQGPPEDKHAKESRSQKHNRMLQEVVAKTLKQHGVAAEHKCFEACRKRLFDISKFYLKDLKTSRGLQEEMKKAASSNVKQVIDWVLEKTVKK